MGISIGNIKVEEECRKGVRRAGGAGKQLNSG